MDEEGGGKLRCARLTLLVLNGVVIVLALALLGYTLALLLGDFQSIESFFDAPTWGLYASVGVAGFITFIALMGFLGVLLHSKGLLALYAALTIITVLIQVLASIFLGLYANDIPTPLDDRVNQLQDGLEARMVEFAEENPTDWVATQNLFGCCGVDFEATYSYPEYNKTLDDFLDSQLTGDACLPEDIADVKALHQNYTTYSAVIEALAINLLGDDFFCRNAIANLAQDVTLYAGVGAGVVALVQIIGLSAAFMLLCSNYFSGDGDFPRPSGPTPSAAAFQAATKPDDDFF